MALVKRKTKFILYLFPFHRIQKNDNHVNFLTPLWLSRKQCIQGICIHNFPLDALNGGMWHLNIFTVAFLFNKKCKVDGLFHLVISSLLSYLFTPQLLLTDLKEVLLLCHLFNFFRFIIICKHFLFSAQVIELPQYLIAIFIFPSYIASKINHKFVSSKASYPRLNQVIIFHSGS